MQHEVILGLAGVGAEVAFELAVLDVDAHVVGETGLLSANVIALRAGIGGHGSGVIPIFAVYH